MEVKRILLGANPSVARIRIPDMCERDKTIIRNPLGGLSIFRDTRPTAQHWINEVLPQLALGVSGDTLLNWFWTEMPENGWMEFDHGRHTLSFCQLEKK